MQDAPYVGHKNVLGGVAVHQRGRQGGEIQQKAAQEGGGSGERGPSSHASSQLGILLTACWSSGVPCFWIVFARWTDGFDTLSRFTLGLNYHLPLGHGKRFRFRRPWANTALGNWQVNFLITAQTGLPFTPLLAAPVSNAGPSRPDRRGSGVSANRSLTSFFDTSFNAPGAAWAAPPPFTFGNAGRNILRGPGRTNIDFSLFKEFPFQERYRLQLRSEFFNLFNHPQFDLPNASIGSPNAGRIFRTVGTPRDIQFSLRLAF